MIYTAPCIMFGMRACPFTRASGRGLDPGNWEFFGPCEMASSQKASAISVPKKSRFPGPPPPTYPINGCCPHQKHYAQGRINHRCIGNFMYKSPRVTLKGYLREFPGPISAVRKAERCNRLGGGGGEGGGGGDLQLSVLFNKPVY
jgi:hypothetical protein